MLWSTRYYHCLTSLDCIHRIILRIVLTFYSHYRHYDGLNAQDGAILKLEFRPSFDGFHECHVCPLDSSEARYIHFLSFRHVLPSSSHESLPALNVAFD
jgi:hypothetical protein